MGEKGIQEQKESHGSLKKFYKFINYALLRNAMQRNYFFPLPDLS
jgi:hypothetical protein